MSIFSRCHDFQDNIRLQEMEEGFSHAAEVDARAREESKTKFAVDYKVGRQEYIDKVWAYSAREARREIEAEEPRAKVLFVYPGDGGSPLPEKEWK